MLLPGPTTALWEVARNSLISRQIMLIDSQASVSIFEIQMRFRSAVVVLRHAAPFALSAFSAFGAQTTSAGRFLAFLNCRAPERPTIDCAHHSPSDVWPLTQTSAASLLHRPFSGISACHSVRIELSTAGFVLVTV